MHSHFYLHYIDDEERLKIWRTKEDSPLTDEDSFCMEKHECKVILESLLDIPYFRDLAEAKLIEQGTVRPSHKYP